MLTIFLLHIQPDFSVSFKKMFEFSLQALYPQTIFLSYIRNKAMNKSIFEALTFTKDKVSFYFFSEKSFGKWVFKENGPRSRQYGSHTGNESKFLFKIDICKKHVIYDRLIGLILRIFRDCKILSFSILLYLFCI